MISREEAIGYFKESLDLLCYNLGDEQRQAYELAIEALSHERPKGRENKNGHWIEHIRYYDLPYKYTATDYTCSECGCWTGDEHNFCPDCGADMRGDAE